MLLGAAGPLRRGRRRAAPGRTAGHGAQADDVLATGRRQPGQRRAAASTATSRRWRWPSAAWRCTKRTGRATAWRWRSPRWARSACGSATWRAPRRRCIARSTCAARSQFHETTGAVYDTLAQIHLDARRLRRRARVASTSAARCLRRLRARRRASWYEWSVRVLTARLAHPARRARRSARTGRRDPGGRRRAAGRRGCEADAHRRRGAAARPRDAADAAARSAAVEAARPAHHARRLGRVPAPARHAARARRAGRTRRITTIAQSATSSNCSASAIRPPLSHLALGRLVRARPARARPPTATSTRHAPCSARSARMRDFAEADAAPAGCSARGTGVYRRSPRPTPTTRSCGGWSTRRCCRICWRTRLATALLEAGWPTPRWSSSTLRRATIRIVAQRRLRLADGPGAGPARRAGGGSLRRGSRLSSRRSARDRTARVHWLVASARPIGRSGPAPRCA